MHLTRFLTREASVPKGRVLSLSLVAGGANALLLALLNLAAAQTVGKGLEPHLFVTYLVAFVLYIYCSRLSTLEATTAVERTIQQIRLRLVQKVCRANLRMVEEVGGTRGFSALLQDSNVIAQSGPLVVNSCQAAMMVTFTVLYLAWLSPAICLLTVGVVGAYIPVFIMRRRTTRTYLGESHACSGEFMQRFQDVIAGFKELQLSAQERQLLGQRLTELTTETRDLKLKADFRQDFDYMFGSIAVYVLLMVVVFLLPSVMPGINANINQSVATILFILGPVGTLTQGIATVASVESSLKNLYELENQLDQAVDRQKRWTDAPSRFERIAMDGLKFQYLDQDGQSLFASGPHHLEILAGELLFIVGGNGAGKSTFLKMLTGLYPCTEGRLLLDGQPLALTELDRYRALFSIVFTDFHLFPRLYGLADVTPDKINAWLKIMELDHKTQFKNGRFTRTDLSTGQRKRLAFIVAVLENRPICIFDELAADQDPGFRKRFYEELMPQLKAHGRTVIVVSHDENYFHVADRILRLNAGQIYADEHPTRPAPILLPSAGGAQ